MANLKGFSDEELMLEYQKDSTPAFEELYGRYAKRIYAFLKSRVKDGFLVEEAYQNTFLKLHKARWRYSKDLPVAPWIFTICRNAMLDVLRKAKRESLKISPEQLDSDIVSAAAPKSETLPAGLDLTPRESEIVELRYKLELSFNEIGSRLSLSPANARQILSRVVRRLRRTFSKEQL